MRLLIIEDNEEVRSNLKKNLENENIAVDAAKDGEEGSFLARTNSYDLILSDYLLPKKSGREVCQEIRSDKINTPIIILSVKDDVADKIDLLDLGADDYLAKPFSFQELLARIKAILRRPPQIENDILKIDDLIMDVKKHKVIKNKKDIYLTRKEFSLLEYFLRNKDNVLSRGSILENVWDMNADPFSNTIESHILNLRKKINIGTKKKLIHTIPGRGYKLSEKK